MSLSQISAAACHGDGEGVRSKGEDLKDLRRRSQEQDMVSDQGFYAEDAGIYLR